MYYEYFWFDNWQDGEPSPEPPPATTEEAAPSNAGGGGHADGRRYEPLPDAFWEEREQSLRNRFPKKPKLPQAEINPISRKDRAKLASLQVQRESLQAQPNSRATKLALIKLELDISKLLAKYDLTEGE